jgi:hypothetical protein
LTEPPRPPRSTFVSVIAWMGIVSGALGTLGSCLAVLFGPTLHAVIGLLSSAAMLVASLGLRKRREWARIGFMAVLAYSAVVSIVGAVTARAPRLADFGMLVGALPVNVTQAQLDEIAATIRTGTIAISLCIVLFNVLIILKLRSRAVRAEFAPEGAGTVEG